jgi:hypothetical protein
VLALVRLALQLLGRIAIEVDLLTDRRGGLLDPLLHRGLAQAEPGSHLRRRRFLPAPSPAYRFRLRPQNWQLGCQFFAIQLLERRGVADRLSLALGRSQLLAELVLAIIDQ